MKAHKLAGATKMFRKKRMFRMTVAASRTSPARTMTLLADSQNEAESKLPASLRSNLTNVQEIFRNHLTPTMFDVPRQHNMLLDNGRMSDFERLVGTPSEESQALLGEMMTLLKRSPRFARD